MDVSGFLLFLLLTVSCPALLQAQPREGDDSRGEVEELKNITLTLLREFLSFSASVKADLAAVWSELDHVANTLADMKQDIVTTKRKIKAQDVVLDGFQSQLDSIQQAVETDILDQGERLFNQTSAVSALVSQLADRQELLYHNLSNEVSSVCCVARGDPHTQYYTTEPPASTVASPTSTTVSPTSTTVSPTSTTGSPTSTTASPTSTPSATESPTEEGYSCGGTSGWRRVAFLNMTDPTHQCPSGWQLTGYSKRTCGRVRTHGKICDSATIPTRGQDYSRVCGQVVAYQFGQPTAFWASSMYIESVYVTGLSITHGSPRQHIWTLAGGIVESDSRYAHLRCPCDGGDSPVPYFVGSDYYCESGINGPWPGRNVFHPDDRLWDGEDCLPTSSCCEGTLLPYFVKELGGSTRDDIEVRICNDQSRSVSETAIELVELYVK